MLGAARTSEMPELRGKNGAPAVGDERKFASKLDTETLHASAVDYLIPGDESEAVDVGGVQSFRGRAWSELHMHPKKTSMHDRHDQ